MYINLLPNSTPSCQEIERRQLPLPSGQDIQRAPIHIEVLVQRVLTVASGFVKKRWSVSRTNNEDLPTDASPMITNFNT